MHQWTHICISGTGNGLSTLRRQAITWTNDDFFANSIIWNKHQWNLNQNTVIFINENVFKNVICPMWAMLSPPCVSDFCFYQAVPAGSFIDPPAIRRVISPTGDGWLSCQSRTACCSRQLHEIHINNYSAVTWVSWHLRSLTISLLLCLGPVMQKAVSWDGMRNVCVGGYWSSVHSFLCQQNFSSCQSTS